MTRLHSANCRLLIIVAAIVLISNSSSFASSQNYLLEEARKLNAEVENLYNNGRYAEAIPLGQRSLVILEAALGPDHPDVLETLNNLGLLFPKQGRYAKVPLG